MNLYTTVCVGFDPLVENKLVSKIYCSLCLSVALFFPTQHADFLIIGLINVTIYIYI